MESRLRLPSVSPGAMLRAELSAGTSLGREADAYTRHGGLVPDAMVIALLKQWMESHDAAFVLDGFPRTVPQAEALEQLLAERGTPLDVVFYFDLPESTVRERVRHRLTCSGCGQIFNTVLAPVCKDGECPECGGRLIRRADDSPEALEHRLVEYHLMIQRRTGRRAAIATVPAAFVVVSINIPITCVRCDGARGFRHHSNPVIPYICNEEIARAVHRKSGGIAQRCAGRRVVVATVPSSARTRVRGEDACGSRHQTYSGVARV